MSEYQTVVGVEVHVELCTRTKLFCGCSTAFGGEPNTQTCPVCAGLPGALPVLNRRVVEFALRTGLALGCAVAPVTAFDRKHYFYPDLPKGYQTSQLFLPICRNGTLEIPAEGGGRKPVRIRQIHIEEDAGKLVHREQTGDTLVDLNRSGVPLLEIVSAPDLCSAGEAVAFITALREILLFLGVSDCRMQEGSLRADINVSVQAPGGEAGACTELKNISSLRAVRRAVAFEAERQRRLLKAGEAVQPQTRRWQDAAGCSTPLRAKGAAHDYRFLPDPDLPPLRISSAWVARTAAALPELPHAKRLRYQSLYNLPEQDALLLSASPAIAALFEEAGALSAGAAELRELANLINGELLRLLAAAGRPPEQLALCPAQLARLAALVSGGTVNRTVAKEVLEQMFYHAVEPEAYIRQHGLALLADPALLAGAVRTVLQEHPGAVTDYAAGKEKAFGFLVGQAMRALGGKADPQRLRRLLREQLEQAAGR